jgi:acetyl esterase/lipase
MPARRKSSIRSAGVKVERDIKYDPADQNLLDVFTPEAASSARPVLIFVHGGGFTRGNKRSPVYAIDTPDTRLTDQILEFVKTGK